MRPTALLWLFALLAVANVGLLAFGLITFTGPSALLWIVFFVQNELVLLAAAVFVFRRLKKGI